MADLKIFGRKINENAGHWTGLFDINFLKLASLICYCFGSKILIGKKKKLEALFFLYLSLSSLKFSHYVQIIPR